MFLHHFTPILEKKNWQRNTFSDIYYVLPPYARISQNMLTA